MTTARAEVDRTPRHHAHRDDFHPTTVTNMILSAAQATS
jgi:translation elongation factor EF-Tu-like GTPase